MLIGKGSKIGLCPKQRIIIKSLCYRGLSEGWDKILGLYSSVREKGKEIIDQVHSTFSTFVFNSILNAILISLYVPCQDNFEVMLE